MNNKYAYREDDVLIDVSEGVVSREYVHNLDEILKKENNIENLQNKIKFFERKLSDKKYSRKQTKIIFYISVLLGLGTGISTSIMVLSWASLFVSLTVIVLGSLIALYSAGENISKKSIKDLEDRLSIFKYELSLEKQNLNKLKKESKKTKIPKDKEIKTVSTDYTIKNLRHKLKIVQKFKKVPNLFIDEYRNGTIEDVLGDLECTDVIEGTDLVKYLIGEYQNEQAEKENSKTYAKRKK